MANRLRLANQLIDDHPDKAKELLVDYLKDGGVLASTKKYILKNPPDSNQDTAYEQRPKSAHNHSHRPNFTSTPKRSRTSSTSTSTGSAKSQGSSLAAAGLETIYLMSADGEGPSDHPVIARIMPIGYSMIGDEVVYGRSLGVSPEEVNKMVTVLDSARRPMSLKVKTAVNLTWRRPKEYKSKPGFFYIVPDKYLDTDVVLGCTERQPFSDDDEDDEEADFVPPGRANRGSFHGGRFADIEEQDDLSRPPSPTEHMQSYQSPNITQVPERTRTTQETRRREQAASHGTSSTIRRAESVPSAPTTASSGPHRPSSGQLQVGGYWDKTQIRFSFDPKASGEAFWQALYQWATQRKREDQLQRSRMILELRASKKSEDDFYELPLNEDDIEGYWEEAVEWIQSNKRDIAPNLFATIKIGPG